MPRQSKFLAARKFAMNKPLVILAAGKSNRMKNSEAGGLSAAQKHAANTKSKGLLNINGRPFLNYLLHNAATAGIKNIILIVSENDADFRAIYGAPNFHGLKISFAVQKILKDRQKPLGTADALLQMLDQFPKLKSGSFLSCNCDNLYSPEALRDLAESSAKNACIAYLASKLGFSKERVSAFALMEKNNTNDLVDIVEKPKSGTLFAEDGLVSMNLFKFNGAEIYPFLQSCELSTRGEKELPTAILNMIRQSSSTLRLIERSERVLDLSTKSDIKAVEKDIEDFKFHW